MKFFLTIAFLPLLLGLSAFADADTGPLQIHAPPGWNVSYNGDKGVDFYTVTRSEGEHILLMFSRWPAPGSEKQIPTLLDSMAKGFQKMASKDPKIQLAEGYTKGEFIGEVFSGRFVVFKIKDGLNQTLFMFSDGDGIWNGQYTGSAERWHDAVEILRTITKKK